MCPLMRPSKPRLPLRTRLVETAKYWTDPCFGWKRSFHDFAACAGDVGSSTTSARIDDARKRDFIRGIVTSCAATHANGPCHDSSSIFGI